MVQKSVYIDLVQSGLSMPEYGALPRITLDYERRIKSMHAVLLVVQKAFDSKEDGLCRWFMNKIRSNDATKYYCSKVLINIKTHKDPGSVVPRIIHSCVSHPYESVGRFIAKRMREYLNTLRHLYNTTDTMLADITAQTYPSTAKISKVDIKDFYMEGYASDLVIEAFEYETNMAVASAMKKLLFEYLRQQGVQAPGV